MNFILIFSLAILHQSLNGECADFDDWSKKALEEGRLEKEIDIKMLLELPKDNDAYINEGSFGKVVKIMYREDKKQNYVNIALKIIDLSKKFDDDINIDKKIKEMLLKDALSESELMRKFNESNKTHIPDVYGCLKTDETILILTELLSVNLEDPGFIAKFRQFSLMKKMELFLEIAKAVEAIHDYKEETGKISEVIRFVHNDIKEANFVLTRSIPQHVKIIDMGLATMEGTKNTGGSPYYMAPEKLILPNKVKQSSDIWSVGVVYIEMLFGRFSFNPGEFEYVFPEKTKKIADLSSILNLYFSHMKYSAHPNDNEENIIEAFEVFVLEKIFVPEESRCDIKLIITTLEDYIKQLTPHKVKGSHVTEDKTKKSESGDIFYGEPPVNSQELFIRSALDKKKIYRKKKDDGQFLKLDKTKMQRFKKLEDIPNKIIVKSIPDNTEQLSNLLI